MNIKKGHIYYLPGCDSLYIACDHFMYGLVLKSQLGHLHLDYPQITKMKHIGELG